MTQAETSRRAELALAVFAAAAVVLFLTVGMDRPIWLDEANSTFWAGQHFRELFESLRQDSSLPAYYILLSGWQTLFGDSEPALRALSALFYLGAAGASCLLAYSIWPSRRTALYAGLFYLASTQTVRQAQIVRMYSLLGLLAALSWLLYLRLFIRGSPRSRDYVAYVSVNCIGAFTHVWFWFLLCAQLVCQFVWLRRDRGRLLQLLAVPAALFATLWGPAFLTQLRSGSSLWLPPAQLWFPLDALLGFYGGNVISFCFLACCIVPLVAASPSARAAFSNIGARILFTGFVLSLALPLTISIWRPIYYPGRYTTIALPALAVLLSGAVTRLAPRPFTLPLAYAILIASAWHHVANRQVVGDDPRPGQSDRATVEYLVRHAAPGDALVFTSLTRPAADYYLRRLHAAGRFVEITFPAELDRHPGWEGDSASMRVSPALQGEASRILALGRNSRRLWLYYGADLDVAGQLKTKLDRGLAWVGEVPLRGPYHEKLLVYGPPSSAAEAPPDALRTASQSP